ncbi:hypothetical protein DZC78_07230 [Olleya aquimaris]|nr:hypothetical protein DZC78_07230 [Olleya aquimaris]
MFKQIFQKLLLAFYCTSKWLVNKKMPEKIIPSTILFFSFPFTFIATGLYIILALSLILSNTKNLAVLVIGGFIFITPVYYLASKMAKKGIVKWDISKHYKTLTKNDRANKITLAFIVFWGSFIIQFWLANMALSSK